MVAPKTATIYGVVLVAGALAGAWYLASQAEPSDSGIPPAGPEPVAGVHPASDPPPVTLTARSPAASGEDDAGGSAPPAKAPSPDSFDSLDEYLAAPGATVEAWLMATGGLDAVRALEFSKPAAFDRLLWLLEEHANAELQDEAARWLQQLYALENGSDAVVTLDIACGQALCAARLQSQDASALDRFINGLRKHDDLPMYSTMQMTYPDNASGIHAQGLLFTTDPSANFFVIPKGTADGSGPTGEPGEGTAQSM